MKNEIETNGEVKKEEEKEVDVLEEALYEEDIIEGFSFCAFDSFKGLQVKKNGSLKG